MDANCCGCYCKNIWQARLRAGGGSVCGVDGVVRSPKRDHLERSYQSVFGRVYVRRTVMVSAGWPACFRWMRN